MPLKFDKYKTIPNLTISLCNRGKETKAVIKFNG